MPRQRRYRDDIVAQALVAGVFALTILVEVLSPDAMLAWYEERPTAAQILIWGCMIGALAWLAT